MPNVIEDLGGAVRGAFRDRSFAIMVVTVLALGIGATTAIFSLLYAVVLRPLPYKEPESLVSLGATNPSLGVGHGRASMGDFVEWRAQARSFEAIAATGHASLILKTEAGPEEIPTAAVSANLFQLLGVRPLLGRTFLREEETPGRDQVVVISHALWRSRFGSDPQVIGRRLDLSGSPYVLIGVMPPGFQFPSPEIGFWSPMVLDLQNLVRKRRGMNVVARLRPGVSLAAAQEEMDVIAGRLAKQFPDTNAGWGARVTSLHEKLVGDVDSILFVLLAATGLVMLIGHSNVVNLMLTRASVLRKEVAIRGALGASRAHLLWHHIAHGLVLSSAGGLAGLVVAHWGIRMLIAYSPLEVPRIAEAGLGQETLLFALSVSLVTGVALGLITGLQNLRGDMRDSLRMTRSSSGQEMGWRRTGELLIVVELSVALVLLIASGLLTKSFTKLVQVDPGFDPAGVLVLNFFLSPTRYSEPHQQLQFFEQLLARLRNLPEIESAGAGSAVPMNSITVNTELPFTWKGKSEDADDEPRAQIRLISPGYFKTLGIPLLAGRDLNDGDRQERPPVAIINESLRRRFSQGEPLGERLVLELKGKESYEVVGIVGDVHDRGLDSEPKPEVYLSALQHPSGSSSVVIRATSGDQRRLLGVVREQVWSVDGEQAFTASNLEDLVADSVRDIRFTGLLLVAFASLAVLLTVVGIYGLTSYVVSRRTPEIGLRIALGASPSHILHAVVGRGFVLTGVGVLLGIGGAFASTSLLEKLLFGVSRNDAAVFLIAIALLAAISLLGCYLPARRAARLDPAHALRSE